MHQLMSRSDKESKSSHTTPLTSLYDKQSMNKAEKKIDQSEEEAGLSNTKYRLNDEKVQSRVHVGKFKSTSRTKVCQRNEAVK